MTRCGQQVPFLGTIAITENSVSALPIAGSRQDMQRILMDKLVRNGGCVFSQQVHSLEQDAY